MSQITDLLIMGWDAIDNLDKINDYLNKKRGIIGFQNKEYFHKINQYAGGDKNMTIDILASSINYFDHYEKEFILFLRALKWEYPTMLYIQRERKNEYNFKRIIIQKDKKELKFFKIL